MSKSDEPFANKLKGYKMSENIPQEHTHESSTHVRPSKIMGRIALVAAAATLLEFYLALFYITPQR